MLNQLLPRQVDNTYRGHKLGLWLFALVVLLKVIMSVNSIFNGASIARGDGIPLGTFPPAAAQTAVSLFGLQAVSRLVLCVFCVLVLVRYRAMVPLMFVLLLLEHLSRRLLLQSLPIPTMGATPGSVIVIHYGLLALMIVGLGLSLLPIRRRDGTR